MNVSLSDGLEVLESVIKRERERDTHKPTYYTHRFQGFVKKVRTLMFRPPMDWKYLVELEDDSQEKEVCVVCVCVCVFFVCVCMCVCVCVCVCVFTS